MTYEIKYRNEDEIKDSGIEWLGKVPEKWTTNKVKYNINYIQTGSTPTTKRPDYYEGNINWFNPVDLNQEILKESKKKISKQAILDNEAKLFSEDSVLIVGIGATAGKTSYLINRSSFNQQITGIHSKENNNKYIFYQFKSISNELLKLANFTTLPILNNEFLKNIGLSFPALIEQQKIANFLDLKTAEFDSIISKKELLIEKLEEAKKSLISEVVTGKVKILDGELVERKADEMKDSGIEWLGMIPRDWEMKKLKYIFDFKNGVNAAGSQYGSGTKFINIKEIIDNDILMFEDIPSSVKISKKQIIENKVVKGDILLNRTSETRDEIGLSAVYYDDKIVVFGGFVIRGRAKGDFLENLYKQYILSTFEVRKQIILNSGGSIRKNISQNKLNEVYVSYPNKREQIEIINYLKKESLKINLIVTKTKLQIQKLKQARQSLISEAVTGKIDLRDWEMEEI